MESQLLERIYSGQRAASRPILAATESVPMTLDQARAAWSRKTIGIKVPGASDEGFEGWLGMPLPTFITVNHIRLIEAEEGQQE